MNQSKKAFWGKEKKKAYVLEKKKSFLFPTGHKSYRWVMLFLSLPFSVPTHSCITEKSQNKHGMLLVVCGVSGN